MGKKKNKKNKKQQQSSSEVTPTIAHGYIRFVSWAEDMPKIMKWADRNNAKLGKEVYQEHGDYIRSMFRIMDPKDKGWLFVPFEMLDVNIGQGISIINE